MTRQRATASSIVVLGIVVSGCTSGMVGSSAPTALEAMAFASTRHESSMSHVGHSELVPLQEKSLEDALTQVRPEWLRVNSSARQVAEPARASVYVDNLYVGELDALRLIPVSAVIDLRFLAPSAARDRFGSGCRCAGGVILVLTRNHN
jgi:hypothetical protein